MAVQDYIETSGGVTQAQIETDCTAIAAEAEADTAVHYFVRGKEIGIRVDGSAPDTAVAAASTTGTYTAITDA